MFDKLLDLSLPEELKDGIRELLEIKKATEEKGSNPRIPVIHDFIAEELEIQKGLAEKIADDHKKEWGALNDIFRDVIGEIGQ